MMDDSLDDTQPDRRYNALLPAYASDKGMIEELRRRGYFVYPKDQVRVFGSQYVTVERDIRFTEMKEYIHFIRRKLALQIGEGLYDAGAFAESRRRTDAGEIITMNCLVVMPKQGERA